MMMVDAGEDGDDSVRSAARTFSGPMPTFFTSVAVVGRGGLW